jgi:hypothetical protein
MEYEEAMAGATVQTADNATHRVRWQRAILGGRKFKSKTTCQRACHGSGEVEPANAAGGTI